MRLLLTNFGVTSWTFTRKLQRANVPLLFPSKVTVVEHYNIIRQPWLTTYERVRACEGYTGGMGGTPICIHVVMLKIPESTVNYFSDTLRGKFH